MEDVSVTDEEKIENTLNPPEFIYQNEKAISFSFKRSLNVLLFPAYNLQMEQFCLDPENLLKQLHWENFKPVIL